MGNHVSKVDKEDRIRKSTQSNCMTCASQFIVLKRSKHWCHLCGKVTCRKCLWRIWLEECEIVCKRACVDCAQKYRREDPRNKKVQKKKTRDNNSRVSDTSTEIFSKSTKAACTGYCNMFSQGMQIALWLMINMSLLILRQYNIALFQSFNMQCTVLILTVVIRQAGTK